MKSIYGDSFKYVTRIYNGHSADITQSKDKYFKPELKELCSETSILCVGNLTGTKGFDQVILAMDKLEDVVLLIAGIGKDREKLRDLAKEVGVSDRVFFLGYVNNISSLMVSSNLLVIPSRSEGFPLVLLEAVSLGVPLLTSDIDIFKEIFTSLEVPRFELGNINDLASKASVILEGYDTSLASMKYDKCYTKAVMQSKYIDNYYKLVNR